jgi:hypothetical protein
MKAHSIHVEEKTVYRCSCGAEFEDIKRAEGHLRHPPQERSKAAKPRRHTARRREPTMATMTEIEIPESGQ